MTYKSNKYIHLNSYSKAHAHRIRHKKIKRRKVVVSSKNLRAQARRRAQAQQAEKVQRKLKKGVIRLGDQWANGKKTYRQIRRTIDPMYLGRWLAVAQGGIDLIGEEGESKEHFEKRIVELVKPHERYLPYIVLHKARGETVVFEDGSGEDIDTDEEEEELEEEEQEEEVAEPKEVEKPQRTSAKQTKGAKAKKRSRSSQKMEEDQADDDDSDEYLTPDEGDSDEGAPRPANVPKSTFWVDVD